MSSFELLADDILSYAIEYYYEGDKVTAINLVELRRELIELLIEGDAAIIPEHLFLTLVPPIVRVSEPGIEAVILKETSGRINSLVLDRSREVGK